MRVTIVVDDNIVMVDGKGRTVDCAPLVKDGIHAVQWHHEFGEEEFRSEIDQQTKTWTRKPNAPITDFSKYQPYVDLWMIENAKQEAIEAEQQQAIPKLEAAKQGK
jgi:hypothetical protein